ncbi:MAG TPA: hypothetical protein DCZ56_01365 [Sutterella sp.]|nr:hypothetical protein [Sutterella sp.]
MRFYARQSELEILSSAADAAKKGSAQLTVIAGRMGVGKTKLALSQARDIPTLYCYAARSNETLLTRQFCRDAIQIGVHIPAHVKTLAEFMQALLLAGRTRPLTVVLDAFDEFLSMNPAVFSQLAAVWKKAAKDTHIHLIATVSAPGAVEQIFGAKAPMAGIAGNVLHLEAFEIGTLKQVLLDYNPYANGDDLLALFAFSGGIPRYVRALLESEASSKESIINAFANPEFLFCPEGENMLAPVLGRDCGTYFAILSLIADGYTGIQEISEQLAGKSIGGQLRKLEEEYRLIEKRRPLFAAQASQTVRYAISDRFLEAWMRYIFPSRNLIEMAEVDLLRTVVRKKYKQFLPQTLREFFAAQTIESGKFTQVGAWWPGKRSLVQGEIPMLALDTTTRTALACDIRRKRKQFDAESLQNAIDYLQGDPLEGWTISQQCLTPDDILI